MAAAAGFLAAHKTAGAAPRIPLLSLQIIHPPTEVEPDDGIARAIALRLDFIAERRQGYCDSASNPARHDERHRNVGRESRDNSHERCHSKKRLALLIEIKNPSGSIGVTTTNSTPIAVKPDDLFSRAEKQLEMSKAKA